MVTGAAQADAAVLVVDVEAGVCEQTRRHAALLSMLGLRQLIVAINKLDRVDDRRQAFDEASAATRLFLRDVDLDPAYVVPVSAMKGWNLTERAALFSWYDGPTLFEALDGLAPPPPLSAQPLRLPVQDVYERGERPIVVGRMESGRIEQGQTVRCLPSGETVRVATVEKFLEDCTSAQAGESIGVTLDNGVEVRRGIVLCDSDAPASVVERFDANLFWLGDTGWTEGDALLLRCATQETPCRIESVHERIDSSTLVVLETGASQLAATEAARVTIALDRSIALEHFTSNRALGRFVLLKSGVISAGGTVASLP